MDQGAAPENRFSFTKVITKDLEGLASFYKVTFGMRELQRVRSHVGTEPIDEIMLSISGDMASEPVLVLFDFVERTRPDGTDSILGFIVADLDATLARLEQAGGSVLQKPVMHSKSGSPVRVAFACDPERRLLEIVQMPQGAIV